MTMLVTASNAHALLPNKTLIYCSEGSPIGFDANQSHSILDGTASAEPIYNRLVEYKCGSTQFILPSLAESWEISADGKAYTFHLRHGVKFHTTPWFKPSRAFNAEDVLFTFERMRNPNTPFRKAYPAEFPYWIHYGLDKIISKIEALDPYTVRFTLNAAHAPFLAKLTAFALSILSAEYAAQLMEAGKPSEINWKPVGTGPFIFRKYVKDAAIHFNGNPDYWKSDEVQLSKLIFEITPDAAVRVQKLKANECQVIAAPRPTDMTALEDVSNLQILSQPGFNLSYLAYNVTKEPLDDVRVRRALDMAIDKKAIIDAVYAGRAQVAVAPMSPLQWSYDNTLQDAPRNLEQAKALLAEADYPNGFTLSLWAPSQSTQTNPNPRLTAEMIQADWKQIGVQSKIVTYEWGEYLKRAIKGEHEAMLTGFNDNIGDPDGWFSILSGDAIRDGYNFSKWHNEMFDNLIRHAVETADVGERIRLYTQAQRIFKREQPFTPIAYPIVYRPISRHVTGFNINPFGPSQFAGVSLKCRQHH